MIIIVVVVKAVMTIAFRSNTNLKHNQGNDKTGAIAILATSHSNHNGSYQYRNCDDHNHGNTYRRQHKDNFDNDHSRHIDKLIITAALVAIVSSSSSSNSGSRNSSSSSSSSKSTPAP